DVVHLRVYRRRKSSRRRAFSSETIYARGADREGARSVRNKLTTGPDMLFVPDMRLQARAPQVNKPDGMQRSCNNCWLRWMSKDSTGCGRAGVILLTGTRSVGAGFILEIPS